MFVCRYFFLNKEHLVKIRYHNLITILHYDENILKLFRCTQFFVNKIFTYVAIITTEIIYLKKKRKKCYIKLFRTSK